MDEIGGWIVEMREGEMMIVPGWDNDDDHEDGDGDDSGDGNGDDNHIGDVDCDNPGEEERGRDDESALGWEEWRKAAPHPGSAATKA